MKFECFSFKPHVAQSWGEKNLNYNNRRKHAARKIYSTNHISSELFLKLEMVVSSIRSWATALNSKCICYGLVIRAYDTFECRFVCKQQRSIREKKT